MLEPVPELVGAELLAVDELLVAEADGERDDLDAERVDERLRQVAAAVGDHPDAHTHSLLTFPRRLGLDRYTLRRRARPPPGRDQGSDRRQLVDVQEGQPAEIHRAADEGAERRRETRRWWCRPPDELADGPAHRRHCGAGDDHPGDPRRQRGSSMPPSWRCKHEQREQGGHEVGRVRMRGRVPGCPATRTAGT